MQNELKLTKLIFSDFGHFVQKWGPMLEAMLEAMMEIDEAMSKDAYSLKNRSRRAENYKLKRHGHSGLTQGRHFCCRATSRWT